MTDQTPRTEAGRRYLASHEFRTTSPDEAEYAAEMTADILDIEAEARTEALDVLTARIADIAAAMPWYDEVNPDYSEVIDVIRAILAGETE